MVLCPLVVATVPRSQVRMRQAYPLVTLLTNHTQGVAGDVVSPGGGGDRWRSAMAVPVGRHDHRCPVAVAGAKPLYPQHHSDHHGLCKRGRHGVVIMGQIKQSLSDLFDD